MDKKSKSTSPDIKPSRFEVSKTPSGMFCITKECSREEMWFIHRALRANHIDDPFYTRRQSARPFFQCGSGSQSGYALIEFWTTDKKAVTEYVDWLNSRYDAEVEKYRRMADTYW